MLGAADFWLNGWGASSPTITDSISAIGGLSARWRADQITGVADGAVVASWADASGRGYTATQGTAGQQPTWRAAAIGGQPAVRFDGANSFLTTTAPAGSAQITSVVVMSTAGSGIRTFLSSSALGGFEFRVEADDTLRMVKMGVVDIGFSSTTVPPGVGASGLVTYDSTSGAYAFQIGGAAAGTGTNAQTLDSTTNIYIGKNPAFGAPFAGDIAEIIMFTRVLTSAELNTVNSYIASRYAASAATPAAGVITLGGSAAAVPAAATGGGVSLSGASVTARAVTASSGGIALGGGPSAAQAPISAAGSIALSGLGAPVAAPATSSGTVTLGGGTAATAPTTTSGGSVGLSGSTVAKVPVAAPGGAVSLSGAPITATALTVTAGGPITLGGAATGAAPSAAAAAGSVSLSGAGTGTPRAAGSGSIALTGSPAARSPTGATGGLTLSGTTAVGTQAPAASSGAVILGGAATGTQPGSAAAGSVTFGGASGGTAQSSVVTSVILGGAVTVRVPAGVAGAIQINGLATAVAQGALLDITLTAGPVVTRTIATGPVTIRAATGSATVQGIGAGGWNGPSAWAGAAPWPHSDDRITLTASVTARQTTGAVTV